MAFKQSDLEAIDKAIASGTLRVRYGERDVTYRSMDELLRARAAMRAELAPGEHGGITFQLGAFFKGLR